MRPLSLILLFLTSIVLTKQVPMESLEHILVYPVEPATKISKRETAAPKNIKPNEFKQFVEEKLVQHTQALEHIIKLSQTNEDTLKQLIGTASKNSEQPKMPEKLEVHQQTKRSNGESDFDSPVVRFARNIPKYGLLVKDMVLMELRNHEEPKTVVEHLLPLLD